MSDAWMFRASSSNDRAQTLTRRYRTVKYSPNSSDARSRRFADVTLRYPYKMDSRERYERTIARTLGELIPQLKDPRIPVVATVERVRLSADFAQAKVLVSTLNEDDMLDFRDALDRAAGFLQRELAEELDLRRTPRLSFTSNPLEVL